MCGIAGVAWFHPERLPEFSEIRRMTDALAHRGPDDSGYFHSGMPAVGNGHAGSCSAEEAAARWPTVVPSASGAVLGHRRLSIIDLAGGRQPIANEDGSVHVILNGEIYNYRELRADLRSRGHRFATSSDTEVIVHLYEEFGDGCVQQLRGMFAIALWDQRRQRLLLLRDRLGQKPLCYRAAAGRLDFASELKALLELSDAPRELDPAAVSQYLTYQYVPHPGSILRGYRKLPPAHLAVFEAGRLEVRRYWRPPYEPGVVPAVSVEGTRSGGTRSDGTRSDGTRSDGTLSSGTTGTSATLPGISVEHLREAVTEAVRLRMRSDVPLGAFLSGGIDSTIIVGVMQSLSEQPIHTFSIGFPVAKFDETSFAREAAQRFGTIHHEQIVEPQALSILPKLIRHYDEPFSDSSAIPMMYLSEMTRQHVTVALSGDGGDELFAGYDRYKAVQFGRRFDRLPRWLRAIMTARVWQLIPASVEQKSFRRRLRRLLEALGDPPQRRYRRWVSIFDDVRRRALLSDDFLQQLGNDDPGAFLDAAYAECPSRDFVTQTTCADLLTYLPCDILTKVDIASMAYGLEARSPFLDHRVVELAARMPLSQKLRDGRGKQILCEAFADLIPPSIVQRPKMGFGVPLDHWFRHELKPLLFDVLLDEQSLGRGLFKPAAVRRLVDEHVAARWDHSYRLWNLLVLELWQREFIG